MGMSTPPPKSIANASAVGAFVIAQFSRRAEGFEVVGADFHLGTKQKGEHVPLDVTNEAGKENRIRRDVETGCAADVALQVQLEIKILIPVISQWPAATIQTVPFCNGSLGAKRTRLQQLG